MTRAACKVIINSGFRTAVDEAALNFEAAASSAKRATRVFEDAVAGLPADHKIFDKAIDLDQSTTKTLRSGFATCYELGQYTEKVFALAEEAAAIPRDD